MSDFQLDAGVLACDGRLVLSLPDSASLVPDPLGSAVFIHVVAQEAASRLVLPIGGLLNLSRFTACYRDEPFWMKPMCGMADTPVPIETQVLLAEQVGGNCVLLVPIIDGDFRCSLQGDSAAALELVVESGDKSVVTSAVTGLLVAVGNDPYAVVESASRSAMARMQSGRFRVDKSLPAFADQFGWCTWDAFYQDVSESKVREGLESFKAGGVQPKLIILDDGWQSVSKMASGETRLTSFAANEKFDGDLGPLTAMAKNEYGIETFLVWHAFHGYWGGVDPHSLPGYRVRSAVRDFSPGIHSYGYGSEQYWGPVVGVVSPDEIYRFYQDYHRSLRLQGVDGVKVDTQATTEGVSAGDGGRVFSMQRYHEALEGSVETQFNGNLINCMSCASEMLYGALRSSITRTSIDFWPNDPASHGLHLYTNAQVGLWFGEFIHPDWDMFQSGHAMGAYHAAGRAVGGCPVYVSDKVGAHDFDLLRKLVLPNGEILRCLRPGRPTRDCLFRDPTSESALLKIFNSNRYGGVVGVFNARYAADSADSEPIAGDVGPSDIEGLSGRQFAVYAHNSGELKSMGREERRSVTLPQLTAEVFTVMPIENGFAPIGLANMFNSSGAVTGWTADEHGHHIVLRAGGRFVAYCEAEPTNVLVNGIEAPFQFDNTLRRLDVEISSTQECNMTIAASQS